jgi:hypothetical protein
MAESLMEIERNESMYLSYEDVPAGYIPSFVTLVEDYRMRAREQSPQAATDQQPVEEAVSLPDENSHLFAVFVHWLYTAELTLKPWCEDEGGEVTYAKIYGLAERLDVPGLREDCFQTLCKGYDDFESILDVKVVEVIIKECSDTSLLRKYIVGMVAHVTIDGESKKICSSILDLDKDFAAQVAEEIMSRLLSDVGSIGPYAEERFDTDDSDSDISSSIDIGSDIDYDTDGFMSLSESTDDDSLFGDGAEEGLADVEESQSESTERTEATPESEIAVTVEDASDYHAHRTPLDAVINRRKRAKSQHGDGKSHRPKKQKT